LGHGVEGEPPWNARWKYTVEERKRETGLARRGLVGRVATLLVTPALLAVAIAALLSSALSGCGKAPPPAPTTSIEVPSSGITDMQAADIVRQYLAATAATFPHVSVEKVRATSKAGERSLLLNLRSDGSDEADLELYGLCTDSAAPDGWADRLNRADNLKLVQLQMVVDYPSGEPDSITVDMNSNVLSSPGGAPRFRGGPPTAAPSSSSD